MPTQTLIPLEEGQYYHIYNRGNGGINIFYEEKHYAHFLKRYDHYLSGYVDTFAYSLLPNHFHLLIKVKDKSSFVARKDYPTEKDFEQSSVEVIISELFRRFFMSYSKAINEQFDRKGSLFQKNFKRKKIDSDHHFTSVVCYIHQQLEHHGFKGMKDKDYQWNSYQRILSDRPSKLQKAAVLDWFGSKTAYEKVHQEQLNLKNIASLVIDE